MVLFMSMYYSDDLMNVKNVDWLQGTVIKGGCQLLNLPLASSSSMPITIRLITKLGGMDKTISKLHF